jgi:hypothetical protein
MRKRHSKTPKTCWTKLKTSLSLIRQYTSKVYATTIADGYVDGPSNLVTLCFISNRQAQRSSSHHGKDLISSRRSYLVELIDFTTSRQEQTRRTRGTQHSCAISTLRRTWLLFPFPINKHRQQSAHDTMPSALINKVKIPHMRSRYLHYLLMHARGLHLKNYSTHARGLRLKKYLTHARGLCLKNYSTHARGLCLKKYSTHARGTLP